MDEIISLQNSDGYLKVPSLSFLEPLKKYSWSFSSMYIFFALVPPVLEYGFLFHSVMSVYEGLYSKITIKFKLKYKSKII